MQEGVPVFARTALYQISYKVGEVVFTETLSDSFPIAWMSKSREKAVHLNCS